MVRGVRIVFLQPVLGQCRHQRSRQHVRGQHREHHRFRQGHEQIAGDAGQHEHRHEHDADGEGGDEGGQGDLVRAVRIASSTSRPCSRCMLMFSIVTVASSTRMPTASARPPRVMMLMVSPSADRQMIEARMDSGMEMAMISVLRQLPRNSRIMSAVRAAAMTASRTTPPIAARTKIDWSPTRSMLNPSGSCPRILGRRCLMLLDDVERRGAAGLEHAHQHATVAVAAHDVGLRRVAVAHVRHVAHIDDAAVAGRDRQVVELGDRLGIGVDGDEVLAVADLLRTGRQDRVLGVEGVGDVVAGQALGAQPVAGPGPPGSGAAGRRKGRAWKRPARWRARCG